VFTSAVVRAAVRSLLVYMRTMHLKRCCMVAWHSFLLLPLLPDAWRMDSLRAGWLIFLNGRQRPAFPALFCTFVTADMCARNNTPLHYPAVSKTQAAPRGLLVAGLRFVTWRGGMLATRAATVARDANTAKKAGVSPLLGVRVPANL